MLQPKSYIDKLHACRHGGVDYGEIKQRHIHVDNLLDFSTCCNPYHPPANIYQALNDVKFETYPDSDSGALVQAISKRLKIDKDRLIACAGSTELIRLAASAYLGDTDNAVIPVPTYGEYDVACRLVNANPHHYLLEEKDAFRLDTDDFIRFSQPLKPAVIFLCNPNNPTGQYIDKNSVIRIIEFFRNSLIVLDEAYIAFTRNTWNSLDLIDSGNVLIIRSKTKDYALAGLRLGYGIASPAIINALKKVRPPWNVNAFAQKAGEAVMRKDGFLRQAIIKIDRSRQYLEHELTRFGYAIVPTQTNFFIVKVGDSGLFREKLLSRGILVRDCTSQGLPGYIRIAPRSMPDCRKLVKAVKEISEGE